MSEGSDTLYLKTPVIHSYPMSQIASFDVFLKLDNLQAPGSFKIRGISNMCQKAIRERKCSHIYCASGGNAGLATAYVCQKLNTPCTIVLPESTPSFTADRLRDLGANVQIHGKVWDHANQYALEQSKKPGCEYVPPFNHPDIWEGHESIILESVSQMSKKPDVIVTCVGGGGLLNGVLQGMSKAGWEDVPVIAMETEGADSLNQSVKAGEIVKLPDITSIAKTLGACEVSEKTLEYCQSGRYKVISELVQDKDVVRTLLRFADDHRFLVEPACGASLAAVYTGVIDKLQESGQLPKDLSSVLIIVCGGTLVTIEMLQMWRRQFGL